MDSSQWQTWSLTWANYAYSQTLQPRLNVKGRMAIVLLFAVIWAFAWLLYRAWSVIQTPNEVLVDKLGLDIPPAPVVTLEEISSNEIQIGWKLTEPSSSIQEYLIEVNGRPVGTTKKTETAAVVSNLVPSTVYDIRVFSISVGRFQTPSTLLHVRLPAGSRRESQDGNQELLPTIRALAARPPTVVPPPAAPAMAREQSGGYPVSRRGTTGRKPSPAGTTVELAAQQMDGSARDIEAEDDKNLGELSQRFQKIQQDIDGVETQIQEEDKEYETQLKEIETKRDKLRQDLKKRDEESSDLRKQVHKAETQNRALMNDKSKKERELQQKENERRKKRDEIAKWEEQISTMAEEMEGIETQKAAIKRRAQSEMREVRNKIEEEQKEVAVIEEEIKEKSLQIKSLEEERKQLNEEDETEETREADRAQRERDMRWRQTDSELHTTYAQLWNALHQAKHIYAMAVDRHNMLQRNVSNTFSPPAPLDIEATRRVMRSQRRPRHTSSHGSSVSSPRNPYNTDSLMPNTPFGPQNTSPTAFGQSLFNATNGMSLMMPNEIPASTAEEIEPVSSVPMSPHADALLPADLLGDESADELGDVDLPMPTKPTIPDNGITPFPLIGTPTLHEEEPDDSPSAESSSGRSFSSPRDTHASGVDADRKSIHSLQQAREQDKVPETSPSNSRKLMQSLFSFNRQRGKTLADQPPLLGSLKPTQSHSFPRNFDELDSDSQPRRRMSYGSSAWAFGGGLLQRGDKEPEMGRLNPTKRGFPNLLPGFGKSSEATGSYDPFAQRAGSLDPGLRGESNSPRPSSTYSFDKLGRPSMDSQFRPWNLDKGAMRNSPLAPDWGSLHSFSRSHSRRPSIGYGSTSNLSLPHPDEEIVEPRRESRPLQAPIGTRPASSQTSQRPATPKLNPAAPSFTSFFKGKQKEKGKEKEKDAETNSPPESRKSKETPSLAPTSSTFESRESLDRTTSQTSVGTPAAEASATKPTLMSRISRKASSNKFGSWKDKGGIFSRKEASTTPTGEEQDDQTGSLEHLGRSLESTSTTPSAEEKESKDKKASRSSLNWSFIRKTKPKASGVREEVSASEVSEADTSERASEVEVDVSDDLDHHEMEIEQ